MTATSARWGRILPCALGLLLLAPGCSGPSEDEGPAHPHDAVLVPESAAARAVLEGAQRFAILAEVLEVNPLEAEPAPPPVQALSPSAAKGFVRDGAALVPVTSDGARDRLASSVRIATSADAGLELVTSDASMAIRARMARAAASPAEIADGFVVFRGAAPDVDVIDRVTADGLEELVRISAPVEGDELRYVLALDRGVAGLRLVGGVLEMLDSTGDPRLRVAPPWLVDAAGKRWEAELGVEGCAVDTDPSPPWGRPTVDPGAAECEFTVSWPGEVSAYPILVDPDWQPTGNMATPRERHEAVLLANGKVMVMGGVTTGSAITATAEIYDPAGNGGVGSWSATGSMSNNRRSFGAAVVTSSGTEYVVVAGGYSSTCTGGPYCNQGERWTNAGTWSATANTMNARRSQFPLTALTDGTNRAMACGGLNAITAELNADRYDPATNQFTPTANNMVGRRYGHKASGLSNVNGYLVLVVGGRNELGAYLATATRYKTLTNVFDTTGSMTSARYAHTTTTLAGDYVLAVAGEYNTGSCVRRVERWDPAGAMGVGSWSSVATIPGSLGKCYHAAALLENGKVAVMGGRTSPTAAANNESHIYDPIGDSWTAADILNTIRYSHTATLYPVVGANNDRVLAAGGIGPSNLPTATSEKLILP